MFKVELINDSTKEIIHHPSVHSKAILACEINEEINTVAELNATLPLNISTPINLFKTEIVVTNIEKDKEVFRGRIISSTENMETDGVMTKQIIAEDLLGILNDTYIRTFNKTGTVNYILTYFLNQASKNTKYTFKVGNIEDFEDEITMEINYETVLSCVLNLAEITTRQIKLRQVGTNLYIDFLKNIGKSEPKTVQMGVNMLSITKELDAVDFATRIIPLANDDEGNTLTIKSVNNNLDYIQDNAMVEQYGIIEKVVEDTGTIKSAKTLLKWGKEQLNQFKNIKLVLDCSAVDLAYMTGVNMDYIELGDAIQVINNPLNINLIIRVISKSYSIFEAYNPKISLSSRSFTQTDQIINIKNKQRIKGKATVLNTQYINFIDNITSSKSIEEKVIITGEWVDAYIEINTDKYVYYTNEGSVSTTYPENIKIYVNGVLVKTIANIGAVDSIDSIVNIKDNLKTGTNTIKFTSTKNGRLKGNIVVKSRQ